MGSLLKSENPDWNCQLDSPASGGRVEGAFNARLSKLRQKQHDLSAAPVYIVRAQHLRQPSGVPFGGMRECQTDRAVSVMHGRIWAVSEKALCILGPLLGDTVLYAGPEEAAEGIELNRYWLSGELQKRLSSGITEIYSSDMEAVTAAAAEMEKLIEQRTADGYRLFGK